MKKINFVHNFIKSFNRESFKLKIILDLKSPSPLFYYKDIPVRALPSFNLSYEKTYWIS